MASPDSLDVKDKAQYEENQKVWADMARTGRPHRPACWKDLETNLTRGDHDQRLCLEVGRKLWIPTSMIP